MKKCIFIFWLLSFFLTFVPVYAEQAISISGKCSGNTFPGETIQIDVSISGNPGLASWLIQMEWKEDVFTFVEDSLQIGDSFLTGSFVSNTGNPGKCVVNWFSISNNLSDGVLFSFKLKVNEDVDSGTYAVRIRPSSDNIINIEEELIEVLSEDIILEIKTSAANETTEAGVDLPLDPFVDSKQEETEALTETNGETVLSGSEGSTGSLSSEPPEDREESSFGREEISLVSGDEKTDSTEGGNTEDNDTVQEPSEKAVTGDDSNELPSLESSEADSAGKTPFWMIGVAVVVVGIVSALMIYLRRSRSGRQ